MPRQIAEPQRQIDRWTAARAQTRPRDELNGVDMAKALGMTWRNLKLMLDEDAAFPIKERGAEGRSFIFEARKVLDHLIRQARAQLKEAVAKNERMSRIAGVVMDGGNPPGLSVAELVKLDGLSTSVQRRKIEQGHFTPTEATVALLNDLFSTLQTEWLGAAARVDPTGQWPAHVRAAWEDEARNVLVAVHDKLGAWLKERRVRAAT